MTCPTFEELVAHAEGERAELADHVTSCAACAEQVEELRTTMGEIARTDETYENAARRAAIMGTLERRPLRVVQWAAPAAAALAVVALLVFVVPRQDTNGFQARGSTEASDRWVGLRVFRLATGRPELLAGGGAIRAEDRLLFSYTNLEPSGASHLSVLGLGAGGEVFWYHPEDGASSASIAIERGVRREELKTSIRMDVRPGSLNILGLFSAQPLERGEIERWLAAGAQGAPPGVTVVREKLEVIQ